MTFDDVGSTADQEFEMHSDSTGALEYVTKYVVLDVVAVPGNFILTSN